MEGRGVARGRGFWLTLLCWLWIAWPAPARAAGPDFEIVSIEAREALVRGETNFVALELRNISEQSWDPADRVRVSHHLRRPGAGEDLLFDGARSELPRVVAPGERVWVDARVEVPDIEGPLEVEWAIVHEQRRWFPRPTTGLDARVVYPLVDAAPHFELRELEAPTQWVPGERVRVHARLHNPGPVRWDPARRDRVAVIWVDAEGERIEGQRIELPGPVEVGAELSWDFELVAPSLRPTGLRAGLRAGLRLGLLREGVRWYPGEAQDDPSVPTVLVDFAPDPLAWSLEGLAPELSIGVGEAARIRLTVHNRGELAWGESDRLSYRIRAVQGGVERGPDAGWIGEGPRTLLPRAVAPGESVELRARIDPIDTRGDYELVWGMVREGERWFPVVDGASTTQRVEVGTPALDWAVIDSERPGWGWTGSETRLRVTVENRGREAWSDAAGDRLAYHWVDADGEMVDYEGARTHLPKVVAPGEQITLEAELQRPKQAGAHRLVWEMVREHERWYGHAQVEPLDARHFRQRVALQLLLALLTLAGAMALRWRVPRSRFGRHALAAAPVLWTAVVVASCAVVFTELAEQQNWAGARAKIWSSGGWMALPVAAFVARRRRLAAAIWVSCASLLAFVDVVYMHFFGSIVPLNVFGHAGHLAEVFDSAVSRLAFDQLWLFAPAAAGWGALALLRGVDLPAPGGPPRRERIVGLLLALGIGAWALISQVQTMRTKLGTHVFSEQHNVSRMGLYNTHLFDLLRTVREGLVRTRLDDAQREAVRARYLEREQLRQAARAEAPHFGVAQGDDLILIQVEALAQWVIGLEVEGQEITPNLNRWHHRGWSYSQLVDQTMQGKTSDGEFLVLNSQHPLLQGATAFLRADNDFHALPEQLAAAGYHTISAHPYRRGFWNRAVLHPRYGFAESLFRRELGDGPKTGWGLADGPFLTRMVDRLAEAPRPWFAFLITLSLHHPYSHFPEELSGLELGKLQGEPLGNYLQAMHYFDRSLGEMLEAMERKGMLEHTVIALYGDHDARIDFGHTPALLEILGLPTWTPDLAHELDRVPLFIRLPSPEVAGARVSSVAGQADIAPTLVHLLGLETPRSWLGRFVGPGMAPGGMAVRRDGRVHDADLLFIPRGSGIPRGGACHLRATGGRVERSRCAALIEAGEAEIELSVALVDEDLVPYIEADP